MSDAIPDDIMKTARDAAVDAMGARYSFDAFAAVFAKAIFAERQQCAGIAYRVCAETRHVTLGDRVRDAINPAGRKPSDDILALLDTPVTTGAYPGGNHDT